MCCWLVVFSFIGSPASSLVQVLHFFADGFICGALGRLQAASYGCCIFLLTVLSVVHWVACKQPRTGAVFFADGFICGALGRLQAASYL